jgi:hypothetical protein
VDRQILFEDIVIVEFGLVVQKGRENVPILGLT